MMTWGGTMWLVGCGNMAGAMLRRWLETGLPAGNVTVVRPSGQSPAPGVRTLTAMPANEAPPALLLLGVKPQSLAEVATSVAAAIGPDTLLVSILAGTEMQSLRARFPAARSIVRAMPNTPVAIGRGVVALHGDAGEYRARLEALLQPLGLIEWIADEARFDLVTALAGSGPAFLFRFVSALAQAATDLGLDSAQAQRLAIATVDGAAGLAAASGQTPATLADRVASPGGMTRKGLDVLDQNGALQQLLTRMLDATAERGREMAAATR
jgi:pyrroline-5-carboxylate reductase